MTSKKLFKKNPNHTRNKASYTRRQLLTRGVVTGFTLPLLPDRWTHPVVQSVLLPAHAQTSPPCVTSLELLGCSVSCSDEAGEEWRRYLISINDDGCLEATEVSGGEGSNVRVRCVRSDVDTLIVEFFVSTESDGVQREDLVVPCNDCSGEQTELGPFRLSNVPAEVTAQRTVTCGTFPTAAISDIVVTSL